MSGYFFTIEKSRFFIEKVRFFAIKLNADARYRLSQSVSTIIQKISQTKSCRSPIPFVIKCLNYYTKN